MVESEMQTVVDWFREHEGWRRERVPAAADMAWSRTTAVATTSTVRRNATVALVLVCSGEHRTDVTWSIRVDRSVEWRSTI
jgi:hypothetical protein